MHWLYLFLAIVAETLGTSFLKMSNGFSQFLPSILAILCFFVALFLSSIVLKFLPVGIVYAIWSGFGIVLVTIVGYLFFKQSLDLPALIGIALILLGVVVIFMMSNTQTE
ncbi:MAG: multidrug efflux SMR transporter [Rhizobiales bacterium]|jgi:small multidrug resistance pump|nr:multidrug efflux SMR transporter [Hyphomicrobiales bacterium]MBL6770796.1 multidrug efflux SMR transporter [Hyphomicrobiales bacterium]